MFYKPLAEQLRTRNREAKEARREFQDSLQFSDIFLGCVMIGSIIIGNVYRPETQKHIYCGLAGFIFLFLIYVYLKREEERRNPELAKLRNEWLRNNYDYFPEDMKEQQETENENENNQEDDEQDILLKEGLKSTGNGKRK